jgi:rifampin ADP-ribosylating transferase
MIDAGAAPVPFEPHPSGAYLHGTKAALEVGDLLVPGRGSNFEDGRVSNHIYLTGTLDAAVWGAELALGDGPSRIYVVEPLGPLEDDPNVTDKKFPGNPTVSYRSREPIRVVDELTGWTGHPPEQVAARLAALADLVARGAAVIED